MHSPNFLQDLAVVMIAAGLVSVLFRRWPEEARDGELRDLDPGDTDPGAQRGVLGTCPGSVSSPSSTARSLA